MHSSTTPPSHRPCTHHVGAADQTFVCWKPAAILLAALLTLTACSTQRARAPITPPPPKLPRTVVTPTPTPPPPITPAPEPHPYATDAAGARQALAKNAREALPPVEVGYYMDVLHGRLKQLTGGSIGVGRQVNIIVIVLTGAGFEPGSTQFNPALRETLTRLSPVFVEYRKTTIAVRVRGDDSGAQGSNPQLAEQRRLAVADYLGAAGVSDKRIVITGSAPNRAPAAKARAANPLRVELQLEPIVRAADSAR